MSDDAKPLPAHRQAARDWVDVMWERYKQQLMEDIYRRAEASRRNGFQPGHTYHKRKDDK